MLWKILLDKSQLLTLKKDFHKDEVLQFAYNYSKQLTNINDVLKISKCLKPKLITFVQLNPTLWKFLKPRLKPEVYFWAQAYKFAC